MTDQLQFAISACDSLGITGSEHELVEVMDQLIGEWKDIPVGDRPEVGEVLADMTVGDIRIQVSFSGFLENEVGDVSDGEFWEIYHPREDGSAVHCEYHFYTAVPGAWSYWSVATRKAERK